MNPQKWKWTIIDGNNIPFSNNIEYESLEEAQNSFLSHWSFIYWPQNGYCSKKIKENHLQVCNFKCGKWSKIQTLTSIRLQFTQLMSFCFVLALIGIIGDWIILHTVPLQSITLMVGIFVISFAAYWVRFGRKTK